MKLEVGMYLRYEGLDSDFPIIQKIIDLEIPGRCGAKYKVFTDKTNEWFIDSDYIEMAIESSEIPQPSFNIIDILEEGDIISFYEDIDNYKKQYVIGIPDLITLDKIKDKITNDNIRLVSILTKEQFEQMAYKVGE